MVTEKLKEDVVLSREKVGHAQKFILKKYPEATSKKRAAILADTLHKMIERSLPNGEEERKKAARQRLFEHLLSSGNMIITRFDLAEEGASYADPEEMMNWSTGFLSEDEAKKLMDVFYPPVNVTGNEMKPMNRKRFIPALSGILISGLAVVLILTVDWTDKSEPERTLAEAVPPPVQNVEVYNGPVNELPEHLKFTFVEKEAVQVWLGERGSILADDRNVDAIFQAAHDFNIHPLLLFAITGQEQAFVPRSHENAEEIANNPFNVFHSWEDFNTNIEESSEIAARTVVNLSDGRPQDANPIQWINRKYAEDPNWWQGVEAIFEQMEREIVAKPS
ncbi:hypothetical protein [Jeotgalibacillus sp. R-1-5s-1]|uniref:hypothetical protein n=1 Tax=Jeotgalibacillus sp. R-1-5s-1 TaxID=2555897 RepID=UPI001069F3C3|nr:hypothetical protein [Jeotgalibacillus sp. R-1-5s-1]TFE00796.1 hypothetical protein E2491_04595 [Jeotgalibacillus sp. R-1-5s-1]